MCGGQDGGKDGGQDGGNELKPAFPGQTLTHIEIINADFFEFDWSKVLQVRDVQGDCLILGNPPWVTNSALSTFASSNVPQKNNFKGLRGIEALTGASNFDICEAMIWRLLEAQPQVAPGCTTTLAMLCKTTVARNIFTLACQHGLPFRRFEAFEFDAKRVFNVDVAACLLVIDLGAHQPAPQSWAHQPADHVQPKSQLFSIYSLESPAHPKKVLTYVQGQLKDLAARVGTDFLGHCVLPWRQGLKHDCAKVMELKLIGPERAELDASEGKSGIIENAEVESSARVERAENESESESTERSVVEGERAEGAEKVNSSNWRMSNGLNEMVKLESALVYPLVKSSSFKQPIIRSFSKYVLVPQTKLYEDTTHLAQDAPLAWAYLKAHASYFAQRKSHIYQKAPEFSVFGIGEYAFAPYKVGISGFYKRPLFAVLVCDSQRPVMADDTCYFVTLPSFEVAYSLMLLLNSEPVQRFLLSIACLDAKRPFTKKLL